MDKKLPDHVAIIMDGNGRWASKLGMNRIYGHFSSEKVVEGIVEESLKIGLSYLTFFAFSTENCGRPEEEVDGIFRIISDFAEKKSKKIIEHGIKFISIGDKSKIPLFASTILNKLENDTKGNKALTLVLAINYGGKWDILSAVKKILQEKDDFLDINEIVFSKYLSTGEFPDPDLLIRTGGEKRLSNFMLYQLSYTEIYFSPVLWPDFSVENFREAIEDFVSRDRRFGRI